MVDERGEICIGIQATRPSNIPYTVEINVIDGTAKREWVEREWVDLNGWSMSGWSLNGWT